MALMRWHRLGFVAAGAALAAVIVLPPRTLPSGPDDSDWMTAVLFQGQSAGLVYYGRAHHEFTLSGTQSRLLSRHRAAVMTDSLLALTSGPRAVRSGDGALTLLYESPLTVDSARAWLDLMERELAVMPRGHGSGVPIVVALRSSPGHVNRSRILGFQGEFVETEPQTWTLMRWVSPRPERPACFVVLRLVPLSANERVSVDRWVVRDPRTHVLRSSVLDRCLLYARFGMPGPGVERWTGRSVETYYWWYTGANMADVLESRRAATEAKTDATPLERGPGTGWDPLAAMCLRGGGAACLRSVGLVQDPSQRYNVFWSGYARRGVLAGLLQYSPERFERFWRSSAPPAAAIEQAWGRPAADVIADWLRSVASVSQPGPVAHPASMLSSLAWALVALGLSLFAALRRQVGG